MIEREFRRPAGDATDYISAREARHDEASELRVPEHAPILVIRRIALIACRPVEVEIFRVRADRYEYRTFSKGRRQGAANAAKRPCLRQQEGRLWEMVFKVRPIDLLWPKGAGTTGCLPEGSCC